MTKVLGDIFWTRGDTYPFTITIKVNRKGLDLEDYASIVFCANSEEFPVNTTNQICLIEGVFDEDLSSGKVTFKFTEEEANNIGTYFYDIQATDLLGNKRTFKNNSNKLIFEQDINKG